MLTQRQAIFLFGQTTHQTGKRDSWVVLFLMFSYAVMLGNGRPDRPLCAPAFFKSRSYRVDFAPPMSLLQVAPAAQWARLYFNPRTQDKYVHVHVCTEESSEV